MFIKSILTSVSLLTLSVPAFAQGFSGGELTIDAYGFDGGTDFGTVNYSGALEFGITRSISVAADLSIYNYSLLSDSVTTYAVHGIYHLNDTTSVGAFIGNETFDGANAAMIGVEGGFQAGNLGVEGYFAIYDDSEKSNVLGANGTFAFNDSIAAIATVGLGSIDNENYTRISAGGEYSFAGGPSVYAELGNVADETNDSSYIGIGASLEFGAARGTTFDRRGVFETLNPGF